ncbi:hypothetical protein [Tropheryma whipplei]|uniref:hypothetical protein n=1 Tax=Tropheryma whipplei TaxID=2039 RepID=UPI000000C77B|nr:hypothetical protein [Tropheryma whipplei]CAD66764.1 putative secreted protein [Tropheryma whipplei TW08/27]
MKRVYLRRRIMLSMLIVLPLIVAVFFATGSPGHERPALPQPTPIKVADDRCTEEQIAVFVTSDRESYTKNRLPAFRASVRNIGISPCRINVGTASQSYRIIRDGKLIWDSKICLVDPTNALVMLLPKQTLTSQTLTWHREIANISDCGKDFSVRPKATPGEYTVEFSIDGFSSSKYNFVLQ